MIPVFDSLLDLIGGTPMLQLQRELDAGAPGTASSAGAILAKCEQWNPGGSVKDRIAFSMIEAAEAEGRIRPGESVIIEATSGNTGIGLALVCAVKGYRLVLTMPASMSLERRALLAAYGARVVLTEAEGGMEGAVARAVELCAAEPHGFMPQQFDNPANPAVHHAATGREILAQIAGRRVDAFVCGVGTGGTLTGVGAVLRERFPELLLVAVEPAGSPVLSGGAAGPHKIQGIGAGFVPAVLEPLAGRRGDGGRRPRGMGRPAPSGAARGAPGGHQRRGRRFARPGGWRGGSGRDRRC